MPLFDFECTACKVENKDVVLSIRATEEDYPVCATCRGLMTKKPSRVHAQFRGSGFHCTEYGAPTRGY